VAFDQSRHRLVFVGGLHRSGTTLVGRFLAEHPDVSGFEGTGVPADEGQHLQDVFPTAKVHGGPGRFGFDPAAHLTEDSELCTAESATRLIESWSPHWDLARPVLVEKSPPNLIRARFLQGLFPAASFVMILRHPIAVSLATQKWSQTSLRSLLRHWVVCHETFERDRPHVSRLLAVTYEELVADPAACLGRVFAFLGLAPHASGRGLRTDSNAAYFARWRQLRRGPRGRLSTELSCLGLKGRVARFGYSLDDLDRVPPAVPETTVQVVNGC
jgi:hypothetical protein